MDTIVALGMSGEQWVKLLKGDDNKAARKALNYLDGHQEQEVIKVLSDPLKGRTNWKTKGFIPRHRNLTRMVVEKSAQLFIHQLPSFTLWDGDQVDQQQTALLKAQLDKLELSEILNNADQALRLLKTIALLFQYDLDNDKLVIDILHRGNCEMITDGHRNVVGLIYSTSSSTFRVYTREQIIDLVEDRENKVAIASIEDNPYGIVPVSMFYDTRTPRDGVWNCPDFDLININESYNLHLTDADYSMRWAKLPTLFMVDCEVDGSASDVRVQDVLLPGDALPVQRPMSADISGGPGSIVYLTTNGQGSASFEYKAPSADIASMNTVYDQWAKAVAADWSVRLTADGGATASSGFQLVVEEMPNLELRKQRQRMYESGFKRSWPIIRTVLNTSSGDQFSETTTLWVEFQPPQLPVDVAQQEEVWTKRISEGRATEVDYFIAEFGLSEKEAIDRYRKIVEFRAMKRELEQAINTSTTEQMPEGSSVEQSPVESDSSEPSESDDSL